MTRFPCPRCRGSGTTVVKRGHVRSLVKCYRCRGTGQLDPKRRRGPKAPWELPT